MLLGGVERLKQFLDVVRQPDSAVEHSDAYLVLLDASREREIAILWWIRFHGIAGVHDQVEEDLLELHAIRHGRRKIAGGEIRDGHATPNEIAVGKAKQFFENFFHAHRLELGFSAAKHGAQMLDDVSGAKIRADDVREDGLNLGEVGRIARHEALGRLRIAEDAAEWLTQLVREGTRKRVQHGHAGKVRQFFPLQQCVRAGLLLARDVHRHAEHSLAFTIDRRAWMATRGNPSHRTIGKDDAKLGFIRTAGRQRVPVCDLARRAIVGMDSSGQRGVIDRCARRKAEHSLVVDPDSVIRHVPFPQSQLRAFHRQRHALLADAQRLLRASFLFDGDREQ